MPFSQAQFQLSKPNQARCSYCLPPLLRLSPTGGRHRCQNAECIEEEQHIHLDQCLASAKKFHRPTIRENRKPSRHQRARENHTVEEQSLERRSRNSQSFRHCYDPSVIDITLQSSTKRKKPKFRTFVNDIFTQRMARGHAVQLGRASIILNSSTCCMRCQVPSEIRAHGSSMKVWLIDGWAASARCQADIHRKTWRRAMCRNRTATKHSGGGRLSIRFNPERRHGFDRLRDRHALEPEPDPGPP